MSIKFREAMEFGFDQMLSTYQSYRDSGTPAEVRTESNRRALQATHFNRKELEEMLIIAMERLTQHE